MKIKQLFLGSAVALMALTACNKNGANTSVPTPEVGGTAGVLRVEISSANGGLRAADGPNAKAGTGVAGTTGEQGVTNVSTYVFTEAGAFVDSKDYTVESGKTYSDLSAFAEPTDGKFFLDPNHKGEVLIIPFKTTAPTGSKNTLFVVVNKPSFFPASFANVKEFTDAANNAQEILKDQKYVDGLKELTTDNQFMMVGMCPNFNLKEGITYDNAKKGFDTGVDPGRNQFAVTVNRVVSKLVVDYTKDDLLTKEFGTGDAKAKLLGYGFDGGVETAGKLYYTLANSNKAMVIYNNPDVKDQSTQGNPNYVEGVAYGSYVTPNMDKVGTDDDLTTAYNFYKAFFYRISEDLVGNKVGAAAGTTPFTPMEVGMQKTENPYDNGIYFMEADNTTGKWLWANTPVAKIYACVLPSKVYILKDKNDNGHIEAVAIANLDALKATAKSDQSGSPVTADGSFLRGADGRYYASQAAANVGNNKPYDTAAGSGAKTDLYAKGRCLYRFPVNADNYDYTSFKNADNRRNHIYALSISDIVAIGDNYDPTDPTDPNVPHPVNPDEPTVKPNKPIAKSTVYAAVKATIANWTVVKNSVTLGK